MGIFLVVKKLALLAGLSILTQQFVKVWSMLSEGGSLVLFRILTVSDSAYDRSVIKNALIDYHVLTAGDSLEAWEMLVKQADIKIAIIDVSKPDGIKLLQLVKENERFCQLRVIILTDKNNVESEAAGLKLGAVDCIYKPINKDLLQARIDLHAALLRAEKDLSIHNDYDLAFDIIFEQAPVGIAISYGCDPDVPDKAFIRYNSMYEQITGWTKEEMMELGWTKITHPDDLEEDLENFRKLKSGEISIYSMDKRYIKPDGSVVWVHMIVAPLSITSNKYFNHICLIQDITERKVFEKALYESERSKSVFLSHLPGLAYRCKDDNEWTMQYVSEGCYNLTGYRPESLLNNEEISYNDLIAPEYRKALREEWEKVLPSRLPFRYEYEIITASGERKWVLELGQGVYNDKGEVEALEGIVLDISNRKAIEDVLKYNNEHDRLTGLYNRDYLLSLLEKDLKEKIHLKKALVGVDLGTIQLLTVNYGYQYSQNLIKKAAELLNQHCTDNCILFRAREFRFVFYIIDYKDKNELVDFCNKIICTLESLFVQERIGGGIGVLEINDDYIEMDIDAILRKLTIASERHMTLFGKDFEICFYDEELEAFVNRERDIIEALSAIAEKDDDPDNELFLQYQPIINLKTGSIFGFEALARLKTKKLGLVPPLEFIPLAEKTKLIIPIGEKIIVQAVNFLSKLKLIGYEDICISINISPIQLMKNDFTCRLLKIMEELNVNPRNIGIEITESTFASNYKVVNSIIEKLRKVGLHIAIDDFGTGYSTLARISELNVDFMKIDKLFVDKLLSGDINKAITSDIISMSLKLGQYTIAEGVDNINQLQYLREHACDNIQGFLISRPLNEDDAIDFLQKRVNFDFGNLNELN